MLVRFMRICYINIVKLITSKHLPLCLTGRNFSNPLCSSEEEDSGRFQSLPVVYSVIYFIMIIGFNYFYVSMQYNPIEIANNLRKNNGTIPGIRPGAQTTEYLTKVISKVTFVGALFLGFVAILPMIISSFVHMNIALGGTTILIVIGVALDTMKQIESMMMMKHYKGFLE